MRCVFLCKCNVWWSGYTPFQARRTMGGQAVLSGHQKPNEKLGLQVIDLESWAPTRTLIGSVRGDLQAAAERGGTRYILKE